MMIKFRLFLILWLVQDMKALMITEGVNDTYTSFFIKCIVDEAVDVPSRIEIGINNRIHYVYKIGRRSWSNFFTLFDDGVSRRISLESTSLSLTTSNPDCRLAGRYICRILGVNIHGNESQEDTQTKDITITTKPLIKGMYFDLKKSYYYENDSILITCTGNLGVPPMEWHWNTRGPSNVTWQKLTDGIRNGELEESYDAKCEYQQKTSLMYTVKKCDDGVEIQCSLGPNSNSIKIHVANAKPSYLEMNVEPKKSAYIENENVTLICAGTASNFTNWSMNSRVKKEGSKMSVAWEEYTFDIAEIKENESLDGQCPYHQVRSMKHVVTNDDDGRQIRCSSGDTYSKIIEISVQAPSGSGSTMLPQLILLCLLAATCFIILDT